MYRSKKVECKFGVLLKEVLSLHYRKVLTHGVMVTQQILVLSF